MFLAMLVQTGLQIKLSRQIDQCSVLRPSDFCGVLDRQCNLLSGVISRLITAQIGFY